MKQTQKRIDTFYLDSLKGVKAEQLRGCRMGSLEDALKKAGLVKGGGGAKGTTSPKIEGKPEQKKNFSPPARAKKKHDHHHAQKTRCDSCQNFSPDVEYYEHRSQLVPVKWLCLICADRNQIPDETRKTEQSDNARNKLFRREFGRTLRSLATPGPSKNFKRGPGQKPKQRSSY